ncbi:hypothetical protein [Porphyrobacter sp. ULC335]|uniref:hypothetical protein n=1 Tax=Porphyrobacter sp. ULC335 TaxID=2854260 RepID=UPI0022202382|nr:hypothetical protein [Porphyrobacter sp. ULC335]UYV16575.1 hypothetical protein KVF90_04435 [Porphyrobacter sp. ULC335]
MSRAGVLSRRSFLGVGGAAVAASLVAGYVTLGGDDAEYRALGGGFEPVVLDIAEFGILSAVAAAMIAPLPGGPSVVQTMTAARIDRELSLHHDNTLAADIKASLTLLEYLPLTQGFGARFSALGTGDQLKFLKQCAAGGPGVVRAAYAGIRFLVVFFYFTDDRTWPGLGYAGPQMPEKLFEGGNRIANLGPGQKKGLQP